MARLPDMTRDHLKPEDQQFYDAIADSRGSVRGPYGVLLHSPDLAARVAHTGTYVRYNLACRKLYPVSARGSAVPVPGF